MGDSEAPNISLAKLYVFAEHIMDEKYQAAIMSAMVATPKQPGLGAIRIIYASTMPASPARRLMADMCAF